MHSITQPPGTGPGSMAAPADAVSGLQAGAPELVERSTRLIRSAALHLGMDAQGAELAGQSATLEADGRTLAILPLGLGDEGSLSLLLVVQTGLPVRMGADGADAIAVLQQAPGTLHAFSASLGATPDGRWALYRSLRLAADDATGLATRLLETVRLAEFVWPVAAPSAH